jgi:hypothetical protein
MGCDNMHSDDITSKKTLQSHDMVQESKTDFIA